MNKKLSILIVEDNQHHVESAKKFFADQIDVSVTFVRNLNGFTEFFKASSYPPFEIPAFPYDGVISDIFFEVGENFPGEVPAGVAAFFICQSNGIPCIFNTAGFHHGTKYHWISQMIYYLKLPEMIESGSHKDYEAESDEKDWAQAFESITSIISNKTT